MSHARSSERDSFMIVVKKNGGGIDRFGVQYVCVWRLINLR